MKKNARKTTRNAKDNAQAVEVPKGLQLTVPLPELLSEELHGVVTRLGLLALEGVLQQDVTELCGGRYERGRGDRPRRSGTTPGSLALGGRRVEVRRPRVRHNGQEVPLKTWEALEGEDPLNRRAVEQMVIGVSTRKYRRSLESMPAGVAERGTSKSAVSRRFVAATGTKLDEWVHRDLSKLDMSNPDSDREVITIPDRSVSLESEAFLRRFALFVDSDQDENSVWRLFSPALIDWLANSAPVDFSFELQNGALCCFVPGSLVDPDQLDELCLAVAKVMKEVTRIGKGRAGSGQGSVVDPDSRRGQVEAKLAGVSFDSPPASVKKAAKEFRKGLMIGGWTMLGASYLFTALVGAIISDSKTICEDPARCQRLGYYMMIPVAGPFIATGPSDSATGSIFLGLTGVIQTAGLIMGIVGTAQFVADGRRNQSVMNSDGFRLTRRGLRVNASPTARGGAMVGLHYRF